VVGLRFKGVLFDFDNTLVDSAKVLPTAQWRAAELIAGYLGRPQHVMEVFSIIRIVEKIMEIYGVYDRDLFWRHVLAEMGVENAVDEGAMRRWTEAYWSEYMKHELFPDAATVLESLQGRCRLGMVTNTDGLPGMKQKRLEKVGVLRYFDVVVIAGEDGIEPKPSPKPFLMAVKALGLGPDECLMVGDHLVNDVVGAKSAGIYAALLDPAGLKGFAVKPDYVVSRLSEVVEIVFGKHF
jgi:HAD superfamily hydrolase (TIGR01549 family)